MAISERPPAVYATEVLSDRDILGGQDVVSGTRIPALTIVEYLKRGYTVDEIKADYPSLPDDGIDAVERWANRRYGADWKTAVTATTR